MYFWNKYYLPACFSAGGLNIHDLSCISGFFLVHPENNFGIFEWSLTDLSDKISELFFTLSESLGLFWHFNMLYWSLIKPDRGILGN